MNFDLSEDQEMFRATAERFAARIDVAARRALRGGPARYDRARWTELAELGLIAVATPDTLGGIGGSVVDLTVIAEALGNGNVVDPWLENGILPALLLASAGDERTLAGVLDGSVFAAFAFAERAQRYNLDPHVTVGERHGDAYRVSGEKTFVPGGAAADVLIVSAALEGVPAYFRIPVASPGVSLRGYTAVDGSAAAEVRLHGVELDGNARLALDRAGLDDVVATIRLLAAAEMVGLAQRLLDETLAYAKQREQFGVPIGSFQALQHRLVDCYAALEQSRSMLLRVALSDRADTRRWAAQAAGAKAYIAENALQIGREAIQMHGGMGITDELAIGHAFKRILLLEKLFGGRVDDLALYAEAA